MTSAEKILYNISQEPLPIIDNRLNSSVFAELDLSVENKDLSRYDVTDPSQCQAYIDEILNQTGAQLAFGGYLEKRNLYDNSPNFADNSLENRNIHLGLDIWAPAGAPILVPVAGLVHSFANNKGHGNYGPTLILGHQTEKLRFYTLYGHLSRASLRDFEPGRQFERGEKLAEIGELEENGHYAPHLHFQIILDLGDFEGDYPGVCSESTLDHFKKNCLNPNLLLKI